MSDPLSNDQESQPGYHVIRPDDIPSWGESHRKLLCESCRDMTPSSVNCYFISNHHSGVPMYSYENGFGVHYNPHLIASYLTLLLRDAYDHNNLGGSRVFVHKILDYLQISHISPHEGMDVWLVNAHMPGGKMSDAMVQSQLAIIYHRLSKYEPMHPNKDLWIARSARAGRAFEWSWDQFGVAHVFGNNRYWYIGAGPNELEPRFALNVHNKAIIDMDNLYDALSDGEEKEAWKRRIIRGIHALTDSNSPVFINKHDRSTGSWHSLTKDGVGKVAAKPHYHTLNWRTTLRVANCVEKYGFPAAAKEKLMLCVNQWKAEEPGP